MQTWVLEVGRQQRNWAHLGGSCVRALNPVAQLWVDSDLHLVLTFSSWEGWGALEWGEELGLGWQSWGCQAGVGEGVTKAGRMRQLVSIKVGDPQGYGWGAQVRYQKENGTWQNEVGRVPGGG